GGSVPRRRSALLLELLELLHLLADLFRLAGLLLRLLVVLRDPLIFLDTSDRTGVSGAAVGRLGLLEVLQLLVDEAELAIDARLVGRLTRHRKPPLERGLGLGVLAGGGV